MKKCTDQALLIGMIQSVLPFEIFRHTINILVGRMQCIKPMNCNLPQWGTKGVIPNQWHDPTKALAEPIHISWGTEGVLPKEMFPWFKFQWGTWGVIPQSNDTKKNFNNSRFHGELEAQSPINRWWFDMTAVWQFWT